MNHALRNYCIVTVAYWSFMLTDGALRMLTLLYFHELGYGPIKLASLFLFYEFFGIVTNLFGGWLAQRFGLKSTLTSGLLLQVGAMTLLSFLNHDWAPSFAIPFVMAAQALSGIAKDLTKMSSKTAIKFLIPEEQNSKLFKWVSILTGSKNAIKGFGFFFGGFLLQSLGFKEALWLMAVGIAVIFFSSLFLLPQEIGQAKSKNRLKELFQQGKTINLLAAARVFLFGARDIWFVVAVPIFLSSQFKWNFSQVGTFMAVWVIVYGFVQGMAPKILKGKSRDKAPCGFTASLLSLALSVSMLSILLLQFFNVSSMWTIVGGLYIFGAIFALNSSVHSFLILDYADGSKAAMNVGFYYMANAIGRLLGTLLSGLLYQVGGLTACLLGSFIFLALCTVITWQLPRTKPC